MKCKHKTWVLQLPLNVDEIYVYRCKRCREIKYRQRRMLKTDPLHSDIFPRAKIR